MMTTMKNMNNGRSTPLVSQTRRRGEGLRRCKSGWASERRIKRPERDLRMAPIGKGGLIGLVESGSMYLMRLDGVHLWQPGQKPVWRRKVIKLGLVWRGRLMALTPSFRHTEKNDKAGPVPIHWKAGPAWFMLCCQTASVRSI